MSRIRERGTIVRQLDSDAVSELAVRKLTEQYPDTRWQAARPTMGYAIGESKSGQLFLICTEGVGWEVRDDKSASLEVATSWRNAEGEWFGQMIGSSLDGFTPDELRACATAGEIDLADFVRSFGDRLEANFHIWLSTLAS